MQRYMILIYSLPLNKKDSIFNHVDNNDELNWMSHSLFWVRWWCLAVYTIYGMIWSPPTHPATQNNRWDVPCNCTLHCPLILTWHSINSKDFTKITDNFKAHLLLSRDDQNNNISIIDVTFVGVCIPIIGKLILLPGSSDLLISDSTSFLLNDICIFVDQRVLN